jgi:hypothetical protein
MLIKENIKQKAFRSSPKDFLQIVSKEPELDAIPLTLYDIFNKEKNDWIN